MGGCVIPRCGVEGEEGLWKQIDQVHPDRDTFRLGHFWGAVSGPSHLR